MYCIDCGNKLNENDKFCTKCGGMVSKGVNKIDGNSVSAKNDSGMKIASIVLGSVGILGSLMFIFAPISLVLSIIGLILGLCALKKGSNVPGILLSSIGLVLSLVVTIILVIMFFMMFENGNVDNYYNDYYEDYYNYGLEDF